MGLTVHLFCSLYLIHFIHTASSENVVFHYNDTYKYDVEYTVRVSKNNEYILEFDGVGLSYSPPARVTVASAAANRTYPVFITARQQKGVSSWQLPMIVRTSSAVEEFPSISRTLCPHNNLMRDDDHCGLSSGNVPTIHVSSSSPDDIEVQILVQAEMDFYLPLDTYTNLTISPSEPKYYFFSFQQDKNRSLDLETLVARRKLTCNDDLTPRESRKLQEYARDRASRQRELDRDGDSEGQSEWFSLPKSVVVIIESDSDICALISIQNFSCPVFDNEAEVLYEGYYLTMTRRGGITLTEDMYPNGFYIVLIVKSSDEDCTGEEQPYSNQTSSVFAYFGFSSGDADAEEIKVTTADGRDKFFSVRIVETISYKEYAVGAGLAAAVFLGFYLVYAAVVLARAARKRARRAALATQHAQHAQPADAAHAADTAQSAQAAEAADNILETVVRRRTHWGVSYTGSLRTSTQYLISPSDRQQEAAESGSLSNLRLCVADLCKKRPSVLRARSNLYLWNVLTVATFYTLPVLQLALTYQTLYNQSGNQDLCYYNFMCANPLLALSDFNHVFSNVGYVALGLLFLGEVYRRHRRHDAAPPPLQELGIPQHYGMLYAMGVALASEGLLSAAYHVCPNSLNFQFDTSFMYVTSVLCMVKLYQSRHPDINARAHATFGVLALIIFIGLVGILKANLIFWSFFTALHIVTCFVLTFQIYYLGRFEWGWVGRCPSAVRREGLRAATPTYCARMLLLLLANLANWLLAANGLWQHQRDFASHLLLVLLGNLFLYTVFYVCMKCAHGERFRTHTLAFLALAFLAWLPAGYLFMHRSTNWVLSPAQSRRYNEPCWLLMFDSHDLWHFASAVAMFLSFNMYLTMDDNLTRTPRHLIHVF